MRRLHLDCPSGVAGDMFLASLIDLGAPLEVIEKTLRALDLPEPWTIACRRVLKQGISGLQLDVIIDGEIPDLHVKDSPTEALNDGGEHHHSHGHGHEHRHGHSHGRDHGHSDPHIHRPYQEIKSMIDGAPLPEQAKARASKVFAELALAEGAVHGIDPEAVHFHEVGSTDAIIDIVGACLALELLEVDSLSASPLHVGRGFVRTAHGRLPVPAPATLRLLEGMSVYQTDVAGELVTPTGAAIVRALCDQVGPMQTMRVEKVGCGAGRMDLPIPSILRVMMGDAVHSSSVQEEDSGGLLRDEVVQLEANLDDLSPEVFPVVFERLFAAGAKDVWVVPATMKKGRPGFILHVLGPADRERHLANLVFQETTTLGLRVRPCRRWMIDRDWISVETKGGPVRVKVGRMEGRVVNIAPEFDDCRRAADAGGIPIKTVMDIARETARKGLNITDE